MSSARAALLLLALCAASLPAQRPGTDRFGAHWTRLKELCTPLTGHVQGNFAVQVRSLDSIYQKHPSDSIRLAAACTRTLMYLTAATTEKLSRREAFDLGRMLGGYGDQLLAHPNDALASEVLALLALDLSGSSLVIDFMGYRVLIADRMYSAVRAGVTTPSVLRACAHFDLLVGDMAAARVCLQNGLRLGADSSYYLINSAWLAIVHGEISTATRLISLARTSAHQPEATQDVAAVQGLIERTRRQAAAAGSAADTTEASFAIALARAGARADFLGADFAFCPPWFEQNGARLTQGPDICAIRGEAVSQGIAVAAMMYHLWDPRTGNPVALLTVDVPKADVDVSNRTVVANLNLRQFEWATELWRDTSWVNFPMPLARSGDNSHVAAALLVPPFTMQGSWSIGVDQLHRHGRAALDGVWPLELDSVSLSDLVVGDRGQGLSYRIGNDSVTLAPRDALGTDQPVDLWFQIMNRGHRIDLRAALVLRRIEAGQVATKPALSLVMPAQVPNGLSSVAREITLKHIAHGNYQLLVQLIDAQGNSVARRATNLFIK